MKTDDIWRDPETAKKFLDEMVGSIPLESEQLDIMMRLIAYKRAGIEKFLDIGCGNGVLASVILSKYTSSQGVLLDFSDTMLTAACEKLSLHKGNLEFIESDYGMQTLPESLNAYKEDKFDVIVSRLSIHHQSNKRKKQIYQEIFDLLKPNGIFINIEHVALTSEPGTDVFRQYMVDHLYNNQLKNNKTPDREKIAAEFKARHQKDEPVVAPVEKQMSWLREIGFSDVDCFFKVFSIAIFGGWKNKNLIKTEECRYV